MRGKDKWCPENDAAYRAELAELHRHNNRRSTDYTTPADRMAEAAALLIDSPSTFIPAMAAALRTAAKKRSHPEIIAAMLAKEFAK